MFKVCFLCSLLTNMNKKLPHFLKVTKHGSKYCFEVDNIHDNSLRDNHSPNHVYDEKKM